MGFGLQKWIYTMKPRKPFKKGNKKAGYETVEYFNPQEYTPSETTINNPEIIEERLKESKKRIALSVRKGRIYSVLIVIGLMIIFALVYLGITDYMSKYQENYEVAVITTTKEEQNALAVFIESGILHLKSNEIEDAITDFKDALYLDPQNKLALYNITLALSLDCEINARNCEETFEYYEKLKKLDERLVSEELEVRMVVIEEKIRKRRKE